MPLARRVEVVLAPILIDDVHPRTPGGFPAKAVGGERVPVSAQLVADGHDRLGARIRWRRKGDRTWETEPLHPGDNDRWIGSIFPSAVGLHELVVDAWTDRYATWRHEIEVKAAAGQDVELELEEGALLLEDLATKVSGAKAKKRLRSAAEGVRRDSCTLDVRLAAACADEVAELVDERPRRPAVVVGGAPAVGRPPARRDGRLVRALPSQLRRAQGRHRAPRLRRRTWASTSCTCRPIHPIGTTHRKGRDNTLVAGARRPRQPVGHRRRGRRPQRRPPRPRHDRRLRRLRRRGRGPRPGGRARLRAPVLARPPLGARAPRVVPPPARRLDPLRREPAQEVPGHLPDQLLARRRRRPRGAVGGVPRHPRPLDRPRRPHLPRRQPAHQAVGVLGVADPRRAGPAPRRDLPGRGVHPPEDDGQAGRGRLQPELHVLHLAHDGVGAARVRRRSSPTATAGRLHAAQLLAQHARHPRRPPAPRAARARSRCGSCWPPPWCRSTASTPATSCARTSRPPTPPGVPPLGEVRDQGTATASSEPSLAPFITRVNDIRRDHPAWSTAQHPLPPQRQRADPRLHEAATPTDDLLLVVVNLDPHHAQETACASTSAPSASRRAATTSTTSSPATRYDWDGEAATCASTRPPARSPTSSHLRRR